MSSGGLSSSSSSSGSGSSSSSGSSGMGSSGIGISRGGGGGGFARGRSGGIGIGIGSSSSNNNSFGGIVSHSSGNTNGLGGIDIASGVGVGNGVGGSGSGGIVSGGGGFGCESGAGGPCGACKFLRRKCEKGCVFAPYFGGENQARFEAVHRVFGASNVAKMLHRVPPVAEMRREAVLSIAFEAQARMSDPIYGCVSYILALQQQATSLQAELTTMQSQLATYLATMQRQHQHLQLQQQQTISPQVSSTNHNDSLSMFSTSTLYFNNGQSCQTTKEENFNGSLNHDILTSQTLETISSNHEMMNELSRTRYCSPSNRQVSNEALLNATELQALAQALLNRN